MDKLRKFILVVDDEEDLTWSISRTLQRNGHVFDVRCVSSGEAALRLLQQQRFDLIISDIRLPGISGIELLEQVNRTWPATRVIVMTAFGTEILQNEVLRLGAPFYIEKPFDLRLLRKLVYESLQLPEKKIEELHLSARIKEVISFNCQTRKTSQLTVKKGIQQGIIYFQQGEIVHAECGELEGEHALYSILEWGQADNYRNDNQSSQKRTIRKGWQSLLNTYMID